MNTKLKKAWLGIALAVTGLVTAAPKAHAVATTTAYLNIDVTINVALSVKVDGFQSSTVGVTWTGTPNQQFVNDNTGGQPSSATVTNDTGILSEKWFLAANANSINTAGGATTWATSASSTSIGSDAYALQAVFGSSNTAAGGCLGTGSATWNDSTAAPLLSTTQQLYTSTRYVGSSLTNLGGSPQPDVASGTMHGGNKRALCWRIIMPDSTSTTQTQNAQILVTATP